MSKRQALSRKEAQALDKCAIETFGIPGIVLMENAGRGITDVLLSHQPKQHIVICCGKGNNGGDGFVVARYLSNLGFHVHILLFTKPCMLKGDARTNYDIVAKLNIPITNMHTDNLHSLPSLLASADWIVDALFGTGLEGSVKKPMDEIIQQINQANKNVLAIDIPSGLDCDTGKPLGVAIHATLTATMVGPKQGFENPDAKTYLGEVHYVDIGMPPQCINILG